MVGATILSGVSSTDLDLLLFGFLLWDNSEFKDKVYFNFEYFLSSKERICYQLLKTTIVFR